MKPMTRRQRRAVRHRRYEAARDVRLAVRLDYGAPLPGWLRPLDYRVGGETGALKVRSKVRTWHLGGRANGHTPPPGQGWDRSGPAHMVEGDGTRLADPSSNTDGGGG